MTPKGNIAEALAEFPHGRICLSTGTFHLVHRLMLENGESLVGTNGTVLDGTAALGSWTTDTGWWSTVWRGITSDNAQAQCETSTPECRIRNRVFIDGIPQKLVAQIALVAPGLAYENPSTGQVAIGVNPTKHSVRISAVDQAVTSTANKTTVANLTITGFATPAQLGAVELGPQSTVEGLHVRGVHGTGIKLTKGNGSTLQNNTVESNGQLGLSIYDSTGILVKGNTVTSNNTDGFWRADWESGGIKATESSGSITDNIVDSNLGIGIWIDIDCQQILVEGNTIDKNASDGIRVEISRQISVKRNRLEGNGHATERGRTQGVWGGGGITVNTASQVDLVANDVRGSSVALSLQARPRGTGPWGRYALSQVNAADNVLNLTGATFGVVQMPGANPPKSVAFSGNTYVDWQGTAASWLNNVLTSVQWKDQHEANLHLT